MGDSGASERILARALEGSKAGSGWVVEQLGSRERSVRGSECGSE